MFRSGISRGFRASRVIVLFRLIGVLVLLVSFSPGNVAYSQAENLNQDQLRREQERLFNYLQTKPDDLDAMFSYSVISIELRDYEQAIATLERILIYRDDLPKVKLELGSAYFRLGSYEVARFYFNEVLEGNPPPNVRARVDEFLAEIDRRTEKSAFSAVTSFGIVYSTNANLGPSDRGVDVFGLDAELDPNFVKADDLGFRASARLVHRYDLDRPNDDVWITEGAAVSLHYLSETDGDLDVFVAKTGPRLALTDEAGGPRIRPFIDGTYVRSGNEYLYTSFGGGADFQNPLDADTLMFATAGVRYRDYTRARDDSDAAILYGEAGLQHRLDSKMFLRGSLFGIAEEARADYSSRFEFGGRVSAARDYVPGLEITGGQLWTIGAFGALSGRWYDEPDPAVDPGKTRRDVDVRVGLSHIFRFPDGWALSLESSYFDRSSNIRNFRLDNFEVGAFVSKSF